MEHTHKSQHVLKVFIAALIWGSSGVFVKKLQLSPMVLAFIRLAFPTLILGTFLAYRHKKVYLPTNALLITASLLNAVRMLFYLFGFTYTSIGNAVIILYTWPIFATIYSAIFLKEKITRNHVIQLGLSFIGIIFVYMDKEFSFANKDFLGMTFMLLSGAVYSLSLIIYKKMAHSYSKSETLFYQNFAGSLIFLPFFILMRPFPSAGQITVACIYSALIGLIGFGLFFSALKHIKASTASRLAYLEVVSGVIFGIFFFHETLSWNTIIGGIFIITSTLLTSKSKD
jgi:drug/metabolite transporter (DMT)-like permease